jgi:hypothetical protein
MSDLYLRHKKINELINYQINLLNLPKNEIFSSLKILFNGKNYSFSYRELKTSQEDFHKNDKKLSKFNEITTFRKENGSFYTPDDLTDFITLNTLTMSVSKNTKTIYNNEEAIHLLTKLPEVDLHKLLFGKTVFDPTCGSGEFIISAVRNKIELLKRTNSINDDNILLIAKTIFGNDIVHESTDVAKFRVFILLVNHLKNPKNFSTVAKIINRNFSNYDYIYLKQNSRINYEYDIFLGNPPYIEYSKYKGNRNKSYSFGNVYADVLANSMPFIKNNGSFGFVLPLSYSSTLRMREIRNLVYENFSDQIVLNFSDRPDCLFPGVHQKLNIVIAKKGKEKHKLFTSKYIFWRKEERKELFNIIETKQTSLIPSSYIPKIGNKIEENIYQKIHTLSNNNLFNQITKIGKPIYLNLRAAFWIKAFYFNPGSKEYKQMIFPKEKIGFILSLLNSTLFWMFWTITSDGWHITKKDLTEILIPKKRIDFQKFDILFLNLEEQLEKSKKYIGSKQTLYEYKHKECKDLIDKIDDELGYVFELSKEEIGYIKNFAKSYRTGINYD